MPVVSKLTYARGGPGGEQVRSQWPSTAQRKRSGFASTSATFGASDIVGAFGVHVAPPAASGDCAVISPDWRYQPVVASPAWKLTADLPSALTGALPVVDSTWKMPMRSRPLGRPTTAQSPSVVVVTVSVPAVASRVTPCWRTQK